MYHTAIIIYVDSLKIEEEYYFAKHETEVVHGITWRGLKSAPEGAQPPWAPLKMNVVCLC